MNKALADLIKISNATGKDPALVLGGGGNTSVKTADGKYMYIKASGTALKDMDARLGWRRLRIDSVLSILQDKSIVKLDAIKRETEVVNRLLLSCDDDVTSGARPSVESHLHALLDTHVIHLHPLVVAAYVNAKNGRAAIEKQLGQGRRGSPVGSLYRSGVHARQAYRQAGRRLREGTQPQAQCALPRKARALRHRANSAATALRRVRQVIKLCDAGLRPLRLVSAKLPSAESVVHTKLALRQSLFRATGQYLPVSYYPTLEAVGSFTAHKDAKKLLSTPALNPDELVYANGSAMWIERLKPDALTKKLQTLIEKGQKVPAAFVVKGLGLFVTAEKALASLIADITETSLKIRMYAAQMGGVLALTEREQDFINTLGIGGVP